MANRPTLDGWFAAPPHWPHRAADVALHQAKRAGRGRAVLAS